MIEKSFFSSFNFTLLMIHPWWPSSDFDISSVTLCIWGLRKVCFWLPLFHRDRSQKKFFGGFIWSFEGFFGFNNLIGETLAQHPDTVELLSKFKKLSASQIKKSSLQNNIDKQIRHKYFCEYFFSQVLNFVVDQTRNQILQD